MLKFLQDLREQVLKSEEGATFVLNRDQVLFLMTGKEQPRGVMHVVDGQLVGSSLTQYPLPTGTYMIYDTIDYRPQVRLEDFPHG